MCLPRCRGRVSMGQPSWVLAPTSMACGRASPRNNCDASVCSKVTQRRLSACAGYDESRVLSGCRDRCSCHSIRDAHRARTETVREPRTSASQRPCSLRDSPCLLSSFAVLLRSSRGASLASVMPFSGRYLPVLSIDDEFLGGSLLYRPSPRTLVQVQRLTPEVLQSNACKLFARTTPHRSELSRR